MRKSIKLTLATAVMMAIGIGAAQAASPSGAFADLSVTGATMTDATYNAKYQTISCSGGTCSYWTRVGGWLKVTKGDAHLQARSAAYPYVTIFNSNGTYDAHFSKLISPGDVFYSSDVTIQLCHEKVLADECKSRTANIW